MHVLNKRFDFLFWFWFILYWYEYRLSMSNCSPADLYAAEPFFPVLCEWVVFYEEKGGKYTTVVPVIFRVYTCPQFFYYERTNTNEKKNGSTLPSIWKRQGLSFGISLILLSTGCKTQHFDIYRISFFKWKHETVYHVFQVCKHLSNKSFSIHYFFTTSKKTNSGCYDISDQKYARKKKKLHVS